MNDVYVEGITGITAEDIRYARELGCDQTLAIAKEDESGAYKSECIRRFYRSIILWQQ